MMQQIPKIKRTKQTISTFLLVSSIHSRNILRVDTDYFYLFIIPNVENSILCRTSEDSRIVRWPLEIVKLLGTDIMALCKSFYYNALCKRIQNLDTKNSSFMTLKFVNRRSNSTRSKITTVKHMNWAISRSENLTKKSHGRLYQFPSNISFL